MYWYSLIDLDPSREAIEGYHVDENEYHMGLVAFDGTRKPAFDVMKDLMRDRRKPRRALKPASTTT
jgi:CDP-paratose 2-epimerase